MNQVCECSESPFLALEAIEREKGEQASDLLYPDMFRSSDGKDRERRTSV
jgi:hypothetical protein